MASRGILSYGAYLPYRRLDRSEIRPVAGTGGGRGQRTVASYDEDATTMAVAAARTALAAAPEGAAPSSLWFATVSPPYLDKTNATAVHAALRLDPAAPARRQRRRPLRVGARRRPGRRAGAGRRRRGAHRSLARPTRRPAATAPRPCSSGRRRTASCSPR